MMRKKISNKKYHPRDASATSHPTNAARRNHFITIFQFFIKIRKINSKTLFHIFFLLEGSFDIDAGDVCVCVGGDHLGPPKIPQNLKRIVRTAIVHTPGTFFPQNVNNIFKICSYIQKTIQNPINAFKITIHNTKHTKNTFTQIQHLRKMNK